MPGILGLVTALARGSGWDPETIWALSPGAAEWYLVGIFQHRGVDMRLKTEHDEEFEEGLRREPARACGAVDDSGNLAAGLGGALQATLHRPVPGARSAISP